MRRCDLKKSVYFKKTVKCDITLTNIDKKLGGRPVNFENCLKRLKTYNLSLEDVMKKFLLLLCILLACGCTEQKGDAQGMFNEGTLLLQKGDYAAAIQKYQEGLEIEPANSMGYNLLGMAFRFRFNQTGAQQYKDKEIEAFKKAIALDPEFWVAFKNVAASLYYQGRKKEAVPYLEKALALQPNDPERELLGQWIEEGKSAAID